MSEVAISTRVLLKKRPRLGLDKVNPKKWIQVDSNPGMFTDLGK
jgi:hypothetical protein